LREHFVTNCFYEKCKKDELEEKNKVYMNNNGSIDGNNNITNNNSNNNNSNNITNNITNIYLDVKNPIPFDQNWDITKIDDIIKESLIFSKFMYTKLLSEILKNEINLNVIIEKDHDTGIVYKNDIDKYIKMKSEDIVDKTITKLKEQLLDINSDCSEIWLDDCLRTSKVNIIKKHQNYVDKKDIKSKVSELIKDIYNTKKDNAYSLSKNTLSENMNISICNNNSSKEEVFKF